MHVMPVRLQLSRRKGFRLPYGAVNVARPSRWGNPYRVVQNRSGVFEVERAGQHVSTYRTKSEAINIAVGFFAAYVYAASSREWFESIRPALAGKDLACWCPLDQPCHADVLLQVANG